MKPGKYSGTTARRELERQMDKEMAETRLKVKCAEAKVTEHREHKAIKRY